MKFIENKILIQGFENCKKFYKYDDIWQQELAFLANIILTDGAEYVHIPEDNLLCDGPCNVIWYEKSNEKNYCFLKFATSDEILNSDFSWVNNTKKYINNEKNILYDINDQCEYEDEKKLSINNYYYISIDDIDISKNSIKTKIEQFRDKIFIDNNDNLRILNLNDVINRYNTTFNSKLYIDSSKIKIFNNGSHNFLEFFNNNSTNIKSYIFSVSAKSIKEIYKKYKSSALNLNLRFFKKNKKVDNEIKNSILKPDYFWQLNNGLVILCGNIEIYDDYIILKNYSIINGGQTTYNISITDFENDFFLLAKIICIKDWDNNKNEAYELANKIAIASNNQKKIDNKDLISNLPEINSLRQKYFDIYDTLDYKIYLETKSGSYKQDDFSHERYSIDNVVPIETLLQIFWSIQFYDPKVKSSKSLIYKDDKKISNAANVIEHHANVFSQLILIFNLLKELKKKKYLKNIDPSSQPLVNYFGFYMLILFKFMVIFSKNKNLAINFINDNNLYDYKNFIDYVNKIHLDEFKIPDNILNKTFILKSKNEQLKILIDFFNCSIMRLFITNINKEIGTETKDLFNMSRSNNYISIFVKIMCNFYMTNPDFGELLKGFLDI